MSEYSQNYLDLNEESTKRLNLVIEIEGVDTFLSMVPLKTRIKYGDPDLVYGEPGIVYGGLRDVDPGLFKSILSLDSGVVISQRIEPEQGRGSVSTMSLMFIDKDQYMTQLVTPGYIVDELMGNKLVKARLGFQNSSFPEDYVTVFRGYVSDMKYASGKMTLQLSDANSKKRAQLFYSGTTKLTSPINNSVTTIPVESTEDFFTSIQDGAGNYDSSISTYIQIDDEVMQYNPVTGVGPTSFTVVRPSRSTTAVSHSTGTAVTNTFQITENGIILALKLMLSGWNGPFVSDVPMLTIRDTLTAGDVPNLVLFPSDVNLVDAYGIVLGDYAIISGNGAGNNGTYVISEISSYNGGTNNAIGFTVDLPALENPATGTIAFRSQFDTLPVTMGLKMSPKEVDVATFINNRNQFFSQGEYTLQFYITDRTDGKAFIDKEIMLVFGSYSITRFGQISMTTTRPPIAGSKLPVLDKTTVLEPNNISVERAINNRTYFNEIQYRYDADDQGNFKTVSAVIDTNSISKVDISSVLPIEAKGLRTSLAAPLLVSRRGNFLITRYRAGALRIGIKTNWKTGSIIETGDTVLINDDGGLQISNFFTGVREFGNQLLEVVDRKYDIRTGTVDLVLLTGLGYDISQRFATISPSSNVISGSTTTQIKFEDSFGSLYPGNEKLKWAQLINTNIRIHSYDYTTYNETTVLRGFDPSDSYTMLVDALPSPPLAGYIIDIDDYPNNTDVNDQAIQKLLYAHLDPTVLVVSGISNTQFTVSAPDALKFVIGVGVIIHNATYSIFSPECLVTDVTGTTITVGTSLGFTPAAGQFVEGIGMPDQTGFYRWL